MLAYERAAGSAAGGVTTAAGQVYDKLHAQVAPLLGHIGVQMMFARSAKLAQVTFVGFAEVSSLEDSVKLRECLLAQDPAVSTESAAALFGAFFGLLTTFIGERLTTEVLSGAWPTNEAREELEDPPKETAK